MIFLRSIRKIRTISVPNKRLTKIINYNKKSFETFLFIVPSIPNVPPYTFNSFSSKFISYRALKSLSSHLPRPNGTPIRVSCNFSILSMFEDVYDPHENRVILWEILTCGL